MKSGDLIEVDLYEFYRWGIPPSLGIFISILSDDYVKILFEGKLIKALKDECRALGENAYIFNSGCHENFNQEILLDTLEDPPACLHAM